MKGAIVSLLCFVAVQTVQIKAEDPKGKLGKMPLSSIRLTQSTCYYRFTQEGEITKMAKELALRPEPEHNRALLAMTPVKVVRNDDAFRSLITDLYEGLPKSKESNKERRQLTNAVKWLRELAKKRPDIVLSFDHRRLALAALVRDEVAKKGGKLADPAVAVHVLDTNDVRTAAFVTNELRKFTTENQGEMMEMINDKRQSLATIWMSPSRKEEKNTQVKEGAKQEIKKTLSESGPSSVPEKPKPMTKKEKREADARQKQEQAEARKQKVKQTKKKEL